MGLSDPWEDATGRDFSDCVMVYITIMHDTHATLRNYYVIIHVVLLTMKHVICMKYSRVMSRINGEPDEMHFQSYYKIRGHL